MKIQLPIIFYAASGLVMFIGFLTNKLPIILCGVGLLMVGRRFEPTKSEVVLMEEETSSKRGKSKPKGNGQSSQKKSGKKGNQKGKRR